jgi:hypothetical protein
VPHVGKRLRIEHALIANEPLSERWVDLINFLNRKECSLQQNLQPDATLREEPPR